MSDEGKEEEVELSNGAKAVAGLVTVGTILGIATWIAFAKGKDSPLDRYMAEQRDDGDGDGDAAPQQQPAEQAEPDRTLWDSIVEAFGPDVQISMGSVGDDDASDA